MRSLFTAVAVLVLAACAAPARAQQSVAGWTIRGQSQIQIGPHEWALVGNAEIERGDTTLFADEIDMFDDESRATASGNVLLSQGSNRIGADRAEFDTKAGLGTFHHAYGIASVQPQRARPATAVPGAFVAPQLTGQDNDVYFFGDIIEKTGPKKYKITKGGFTTCLQPTPRWNLTGSTIVVNINHYTMLQNMVLNVKGVPLLYLPFMYYPTKQDDRATGFLIPTYGSSSLLGQSIHNAFFWAIDRSQDLTIQHEWFSKLGQGLGGEYRYNWGRGDAGSLTAFALTPKSDQADGLPTGRSYDLQGSATEALPARFLARGNVNYFSDLATHQIFNNGFSAFSNEREYSGNVTGAWRNYAVNATFIHDEYFSDTTDRTVSGGTPRIDVSRSERPLFPGSLLYFGATGEYVHLSNDSIAEDSATGIETHQDHTLSRLDFSPTIRYPFTKLQWLTVNSSIAFHDTYYSRSYARPVIAGDLDPTPNLVIAQGLNRRYATVQAQITGPVFSRIFDTPGNGYAEKFKHTIEPDFTIARVTSIDDSLRQRIVINDGTDYAVGGSTNITYGLTNHFLAKRKIGQSQTSTSTEIAMFKVDQSYYTNATQSQFDIAYLASPTSTQPSHFSAVRAELRVTPATTTTADLTAQFDPRSHHMNLMTMSGTYAWSTLLRTTGAWTRVYNEDPTGVLGRSLVSNSLSATSNIQTRDNRFGGMYQLMYDFHNAPHLQSQTVSGFYNAQCCGLAMSYMNRPLYGFASPTSNHTLFLSVTLAGLGSVSPFSGGAGMPGQVPYR